MIDKYIVSKSKNYYRAFPDLILINNKLICIFSEMNKETKESNISYAESTDRGKTWSKVKIFQRKIDDNGRWDCPRICQIKNGDIIILCSWYLKDDKDKKKSHIYIWKCDKDLKIINHKKTTMTGIVPDKLLELENTWIVSTHERNKNLETLIYYSYDKGKTWSNKKTLAKDSKYNLCETSIIKIKKDILVGLMRENSSIGEDCLKIISYDNGKTWSKIYKMPIPACHRPVVTKLNSGKYLVTYRFNQGVTKGKGVHGQNIFGCLLTKDDMLETNRDKIISRIFPIDYDRNIYSNCGYTGVVQFKDGMIYVVSHIVDDNPLSQIRGYSFYEKDLIKTID